MNYKDFTNQELQELNEFNAHCAILIGLTRALGASYKATGRDSTVSQEIRGLIADQEKVIQDTRISEEILNKLMFTLDDPEDDPESEIQ